VASLTHVLRAAQVMMVTLGPKHGTGNIGPVTLTGFLSFMPAKVSCPVACRAFIMLNTSCVHMHYVITAFADSMCRPDSGCMLTEYQSSPRRQQSLD